VARFIISSIEIPGSTAAVSDCESNCNSALSAMYFPEFGHRVCTI
jgi:hypothetical protein